LALGLAISSTHSAEGADNGELPLMLKILQQRQREWQLNKATEHHSKRWSGPLVSVCGTGTGTANATTVNKADEKGRVGGADADKIDCHVTAGSQRHLQKSAKNSSLTAAPGVHRV